MGMKCEQQQVKKPLLWENCVDATRGGAAAPAGHALWVPQGHTRSLRMWEGRARGLRRVQCEGTSEAGDGGWGGHTAMQCVSCHAPHTSKTFTHWMMYVLPESQKEELKLRGSSEVESLLSHA